MEKLNFQVDKSIDLFSISIVLLVIYNLWKRLKNCEINVCSRLEKKGNEQK